MAVKEIISLVQLLDTDNWEKVLKNNNGLVKAASIGKPFIMKCSGLEDPFEQIMMDPDKYLKDNIGDLKDEDKCIGVVIGEEVEVREYGTSHLYPVQFYRVEKY